MKLTQEDKANLHSMLSSPGWVIIEKWLANRENLVTDAIKLNVMSLKWEESPKWNAYYAGQISVLRSLPDFIKRALEPRPEKKPREE